MTLTEQDSRDLTASAYRRAIEWKRDQGDEFAARHLERGLNEVIEEWARQDGRLSDGRQ